MLRGAAGKLGVVLGLDTFDFDAQVLRQCVSVRPVPREALPLMLPCTVAVWAYGQSVVITHRNGNNLKVRCWPLIGWRARPSRMRTRF